MPARPCSPKAVHSFLVPGRKSNSDPALVRAWWMGLLCETWKREGSEIMEADRQRGVNAWRMWEGSVVTGRALSPSFPDGERKTIGTGDGEGRSRWPLWGSGGASCKGKEILLVLLCKGFQPRPGRTGTTYRGRAALGRRGRAHPTSWEGFTQRQKVTPSFASALLQACNEAWKLIAQLSRAGPSSSFAGHWGVVTLMSGYTAGCNADDKRCQWRWWYPASH